MIHRHRNRKIVHLQIEIFQVNRHVIQRFLYLVLLFFFKPLNIFSGMEL